MIIANACEKRSHFFYATSTFGSTIILHKDFARQSRTQFRRLKDLALTDTVAIANIHSWPPSKRALDTHS
jgi:hypothetical protein